MRCAGTVSISFPHPPQEQGTEAVEATYTLTEVAAMLQVRASRVRNWVRAGILPGRKIDGMWQVEGAEFWRFESILRVEGYRSLGAWIKDHPANKNVY